MPINPRTDPYVLEGRIVTMGPQDVIEDGAIYIKEGRIEAVEPSSAEAPAGFESAQRVRTGDTIYPGLIELHNHLSYNAVPLWDVPQKFINNSRWRNHDDYRRLITKPAQVLGKTDGVVEAVVRYVECRCLLGGATTSQGITLYNASHIKAFYQGIIRNVERTDDPMLPAAGTKIGNPKRGEAEGYLDKLRNHTCYLQHQSEGIGETARGWFLNLQMDDGGWAINDAFCGIHSTALNGEDFQVVSQRGGSMVWSPLSNYLLYGGTADIRAAKDAGILIGIGCDWGPSGSKNLLGEMKVAWLASEQQGGVFSPQEITAMATTNAAKILKWDQTLGSIEAGKRADFMVVNGQRGDDYLRLIEARETSVSLVVIDGVPRVGQRTLMERFGAGTEEIKVGRSTRILNLADETTHSLVRDLTLTEATHRLEGALQNLPTLAENLDNATGGGLFAGSADVDGAVWQIALDFEEDDEEEFALAAQPFAYYVRPMTLEGITVVDDPGFLRKLVAARNLPEFVKKGLPPLYGEEIPLPQSADFLTEAPDSFPPRLLSTTQDLKTFLRTWGELRQSDRLTIVKQALLLLEENYVHLPLKRAMHAVDPVQQLKLLKYRLTEADEGELGPDIEFHNELVDIFNSLRDLHTTYRLPSPFREKTAWLPFFIEEYWESGQRKYLVSKTVSDVGPHSFQPGVEVLHWNGLPIERAIAQNAERRPGSNLAARHARGLDAMTIRPLAHGHPPDEEWVTLRYADADGETHEWTQEWLVFEPGRGVNNLDPESILREATAIGLDAMTDDVQEVKKVLYAGSLWREESRAVEEGAATPVQNTEGGLPTILPTVFRARPLETARGTFGYIRIFTFNVRDADLFVKEFVRLIHELPQRGLIIDARGNPGGAIHAAERLLQVLTPHRIEPEKAQFINTSLNLKLCRQHAPSTLFPDFDLGPWIDSMSQSVTTGAIYSLGYPITPEDICNEMGQKYYGPVILIVDALCYSATDIFAAGFQDHGIGPILGTSTNTGAGGANVWSHRQLRALTSDQDHLGSTSTSPYTPLPQGSDLRVAIRRTVRSGGNAGDVVEDKGITPDHRHLMTRRDLLEDNRDLVECAAEFLESREMHGIQVVFRTREGAFPYAEVKTTHISRLDVFLDHRPLRSLDIQEEVTVVDLDEISSEVQVAGVILELHGFLGDELVAAYRGEIPQRRCNEMSDNEYLGIVERGEFAVLDPESARGRSLRFTRAGMQVSFPPEHDEIDFTEYEGKAVMVRGMGDGIWVLSAQVVDVGGPTVTERVRSLLVFQEEPVVTPGQADSPLGTNLTKISDWSREWSFVEAFKASRPWISGGCDLRLMVASDEETELESIREFEREFESKKKACAVLIVRAASDSEKWTIAGFDNEEEFSTVVLDDPSHELSEELVKEPANRRRIAELAASELHRRTWEDGRSLDLDENGWVRSLREGQIARTVLFANMQDRYPSGRYIVRYRGSGEIEYRGGTKNEGASRAGRDVIDVDASRADIIWINIISVDPDDYLRDMRVTMPGGACSDDSLKWCANDADCHGRCVPFEADAQQTFHPRFLESIKNYKVLRFMGWMATNDSQQREWNDRPRLSDPRWSLKGVPLEVMVELANRLQADPWFCMPHLATKEYVSEFAALVYLRLRADRKVYVEHSNEVWNGIFAQAHYASEQGRLHGLSDDEYEARRFYHAKRSLEIFEIWREVFGAESQRIVRVLGSQAADPEVSRQLLDYANTSRQTDALAIAHYFGGDLGRPGDQDPDDDQGPDRVRQMSLDELFDDLESRALPQAMGWIRSQAQVARDYGVDLIAYEGGQHLAGHGGVENDQVINALFDAANRDERMGVLYRRLLDGWRQEGGKLFVHFLNCSAYGKWGRWGAREYMQQERSEAPKFDALQTFMEENPIWW